MKILKLISVILALVPITSFAQNPYEYQDPYKIYNTYSNDYGGNSPYYNSTSRDYSNNHGGNSYNYSGLENNYSNDRGFNSPYYNSQDNNTSNQYGDPNSYRGSDNMIYNR